MKKYVRPEIIAVDAVAEGVYLASGSDAKPVCQSSYMNGTYHAPEGGKVEGGIYTYGSIGCRSCPADINYHCAIASGEYDSIRPNLPCMPQWESKGHSTNDTYVNSNFNEYEPT